MKISTKNHRFWTISATFAKISKNYRNFAKFRRKSVNFEFGAVQRYVYLVDLEKCLKNEYLVAKIGLDTAENEPSEKCGFGSCYNNLRPTLYHISLVSPAASGAARTLISTAALFFAALAPALDPSASIAASARATASNRELAGLATTHHSFLSSVSAVSTATITRNGAFFHIFRDLHDFHTFATL